MRLVETATRLAMLLSQRGKGHTSLMQEGLNNFRGDAIVIGHTAYAARDFAHFRRQTRDMYKTVTLSIDRMESSYGIRGAVCIDHHALAGLLDGLASAVVDAERSALASQQDRDFVMHVKAAQDEKVERLVRINNDLKEALAEYAAAPAIKDPVLIAALVKGVAEEGSLAGRYGGRFG